MTAHEKRTRFVQMTCRHKVELTEPLPTPGDEQYCIRCGDYSVVELWLDTFKVRCQAARSCYSRSFVSEEQAVERARKHVNSYPRHRVLVKRNSQTIVEISNTGEDLFSTHSELHAIASNAQNLLRQAFPGTEIVN